MMDALIRVRMVYTLTPKAMGGIPIVSVQFCYVFSTNDTIVYTFEGKGGKESEFRLVSKTCTKFVGHI